MIEIAISLAIIGFALTSILLVLPYGMNTQRDNREETIISQDATVLLENIRNGARGANHLTNYVYTIVNSQAVIKNGVMTFPSPIPYGSSQLTNGAMIIGLLSTPEFTDLNGLPLAYPPTDGYSNHVVAYVRCISGLATEKPPQNNATIVGDTFSYRAYCVNAAVGQDNISAAFNKQLNGNLRELRLTLLWPQLPTGKLPANPSHQTYRATIAGQLAQDPTNTFLYFYHPQSFIFQP
jgi:type II secretory pathway pseudopilin PulG